MNFADAHALKTLPEKIAAADIQIAELEKSLSDNALYAKDPKRFAALSAQLVKIRSEKEADEERWLILEMQREALETLRSEKLEAEVEVRSGAMPRGRRG